MEDNIRHLLSLQVHTLHKQKIHIYDPTIMNYLNLIRQYPNILDGEHYLELLQIYTSDKIKYSKYGEAIKVYLEMKDRKLIKSHILKGNRITMKGRWYMIIHNPSLTLWSIIIGIVIAVATILLTT